MTTSPATFSSALCVTRTFTSLTIPSSQRWYKGRVTTDPPSHAAIVVIKFGGSSLASVEHLERVADLVASRAKTHRVVVVVSAMGKTTDALVEQARSLCETPNPRELDMLLSTGERQSMAMLALAVSARDVGAISLTGSQVGIITDHQHGRARVVEVRPFRVVDELDAGHRVVVIGGFQGVSYKREVTTLGRGGSDTTAVALAAALGADCEIYSAVAGVFSADPRVVATATPLPELDYGTMGALSRAGAKVLHASAVELAAELGVVIHARATHGAATQTRIHDGKAPEPRALAVASDRVILVRAKISERERDTTRGAEATARLLNCFDTFDLQHLLWSGDELSGWISRTQRDDASDALAGLRTSAAELGDPRVEIEATMCASISIVGPGVSELRGVVAALGAALRSLEIPLLRLEHEHSVVRVFVPESHQDRATRELHAHLVESS